MIYYNSYLDNRGVNEDDMKLAALWRHPPSLSSLCQSLVSSWGRGWGNTSWPTCHVTNTALWEIKWRQPTNIALWESFWIQVNYTAHWKKFECYQTEIKTSIKMHIFYKNQGLFPWRFSRVDCRTSNLE